ncbi:hypothetical protein D3C71_1545510 [compost metagenome]
MAVRALCPLQRGVGSAGAVTGVQCRQRLAVEDVAQLAVAGTAGVAGIAEALQQLQEALRADAGGQRQRGPVEQGLRAHGCAMRSLIMIGWVASSTSA